MAAAHLMRVIPFVTCTSGLPANETTFAAVAKKHGYSTALIGKWHLGVYCDGGHEFCHHPLQHGFDYFYGVPLSNAREYGPKGWNTIFRHFPGMFRIIYAIIIGGAVLCIMLCRFGVLPRWLAVLAYLLMLIPTLLLLIVATNMPLLNALIMKNYDYLEQPLHFKNLTQRLVNEGVTYMEQRKEDGKPFLLMMSWLQVHTFLHTSEEFRGHSKYGQYGDNVEEMDWSVGEIVNALERLGMLDNTFVYFSSDNGGLLEGRSELGIQEGGWNGIYRGSKAQGGMDGGIRVPTAAMWRGHIHPGTVIDAPTSQMDLFSTLSAAVWSEPLPADRVIDGRNIYPLLTGQDQTPPHRFMIHYCGMVIHSARYVPNNEGDVYKLYYATPNWLPGTYQCEMLCKCTEGHVTFHDPPLLYNIGKDPAEIYPLSAAAYPAIVKAINDAVEQHKNGVDAVPNQLELRRLIPKLWKQPCCNFPSCDCIDPTYEDIVRAL